MPIYDSMSRYNDYQKNWVANKKKIAYPLSVYTSYTDQVKEKLFPIKLKFGLEVCYEPE